MVDAAELLVLATLGKVGPPSLESAVLEKNFKSAGSAAPDVCILIEGDNEEADEEGEGACSDLKLGQMRGGCIVESRGT